MTTFNGNTFYAADGSWGDATDLIIIDTSSWTDEDETAFAGLNDDQRAEYANTYGDGHLRPTDYVAKFNDEEANDAGALLVGGVLVARVTHVDLTA